MVTHKCNKEGEIATMAEKINNIEKKLDTIDKKLDNLPELFNSRYATIESVNNLRDEFKEFRDNQINSNNWTRNKIIDMTWKIAVITASIAIIIKQYI